MCLQIEAVCSHFTYSYILLVIICHFLKIHITGTLKVHFHILKIEHDICAFKLHIFYIVSRQNYYILTWLKNAAHVASVTCFFDRKTSVTGY